MGAGRGAGRGRAVRWAGPGAGALRAETSLPSAARCGAVGSGEAVRAAVVTEGRPAARPVSPGALRGSRAASQSVFRSCSQGRSSPF